MATTSQPPAPASPLTHTWSLAVEEQFYLVWPLVVLAVMHLSRNVVRGVKVLLALSAMGMAASTAEMALRYAPATNNTRIYFGTDTHAQSVLVGATLACLLTLVQMRRGAEGMAPAARNRASRLVLGVLGVAGVGGTLALAYELDGTGAFTYQGGIFLAALSAAAILVAAVCVPGGVLARALALRPLVWIGTVSYGAYLWHYPVAVFIDPAVTGLTGFWLLVLRIAATFSVAAASYYLVERPIMVGTFWRSLRALGPAVAAAAVTVVVIVAGTAAPAAAVAPVHRYRAVTVTTRQPPSWWCWGTRPPRRSAWPCRPPRQPGTRVLDQALFGCGLAIGSWASNNPPKPELAMFPACNEATPAPEQWPARDAVAVEGTGPGDVVLFVAGNWECQDLEQNGHWTNITEPAFQREELTHMRRVVRIGTAHGAHFVFATMPAMAGGAAFHESPFPEDSPARRLIYDRLIKKVASEFPNRVSIVDLGGILSPGGTFTEYRDGVQVRTPDGVHTPAYAPGNPFAGNSTEAVAHAFYDWLSPRLWPLIIATDVVPTTGTHQPASSGTRSPSTSITS